MGRAHSQYPRWLTREEIDAQRLEAAELEHSRPYNPLSRESMHRMHEHARRVDRAFNEQWKQTRRSLGW